MTDTEFNFEIKEYNNQTVIRLMNNYINIRMRLLDGMPTRPTPLYTSGPKDQKKKKEQPLGSNSGQSWPFMEKPKAQPNIDGKKKARMIEELHVSAIDLEEALAKLHEGDLDLVLKYYVYQTHNLDDLCNERNLTSKGGMQERLQRVIKKIVKHMNGPRYE